MELIFATHNKHKINEIAYLLDPGIKLLSLYDLHHYADIEETGSSLQENALIKAKSIHKIYNLNTFADDTGLEIEALNGEPGILSARYAGDDNNALRNMNKVLNLMKGVKNRKARFVSVIALIYKHQEYFFEGHINGIIIEQATGENGFGYDPIFMPDNYDITFAQMDLDLKSKISHRSIAINKLIKFLNQLQI